MSTVHYRGTRSETDYEADDIGVRTVAPGEPIFRGFGGTLAIAGGVVTSAPARSTSAPARRSPMAPARRYNDVMHGLVLKWGECATLRGREFEWFSGPETISPDSMPALTLMHTGQAPRAGRVLGDCVRLRSTMAGLMAEWRLRSDLDERIRSFLAAQPRGLSIGFHPLRPPTFTRNSLGHAGHRQRFVRLNHVAIVDHPAYKTAHTYPLALA